MTPAAQASTARDRQVPVRSLTVCRPHEGLVGTTEELGPNVLFRRTVERPGA